eukprot:gene1971-33385_t
MDINFATVTVALGRWCNMRCEERQPYFIMAEADLQRYNTETARLAGQVVTSNKCHNMPTAVQPILSNHPLAAALNATRQRAVEAALTPGPPPMTPTAVQPVPPNHPMAAALNATRQRAVEAAVTAGPPPLPPPPPNYPIVTAFNATHQRAVEAAREVEAALTPGPPPVTPTAVQGRWRQLYLQDPPPPPPPPPNHPVYVAINAAHQRAVEAARTAGAPHPPPPHMYGLLLGEDVAQTTTEAFGGSPTYGGHQTMKLQYYSSDSDMCNNGENNTLVPSPMPGRDEYWDELQQVAGPPLAFTEEDALLQDFTQGNALFPEDETPSEPKPAVNASDSKAAAAGFGNGESTMKGAGIEVAVMLIKLSKLQPTVWG